MELLERVARQLRQGAGVPILLILMLSMMVLPLPPMALDLLFTFNITLSLVIVLAVIYANRPLDLGVFPTVLLIATLLRLALNVASTRVVLLNGHNGTGAAGRVIEAFGDFVVGGNFAVGLVVFAILVIINFIVVTKGAGRISEVSARFTLDAMPGRQMAIDADLNAGLVTQDEARQRREEIRQEADFYGSMDGASKFVRGDATAGILILFINIIGGIAIGPLQHGMPFGQALEYYTLLTIGDGLVAQIPSLLLSTAVAIIVTRMSGSQDMGEQVVKQLLGNSRTLGVTAGVLGLLGLIPGMPNVVFLGLAAACGTGAWLLNRQPTAAEQAAAAEQEAPTEAPKPPELSWDDVSDVDALGLEVGFRLIGMVDKRQGGELMNKIKGVRKKFTQELGFLVQPVHIRDNLELNPNAYRIKLLDVPIGEGEIFPNKELAIAPNDTVKPIPGQKTKEPAFGLDAVWIDPSERERAQTLGYSVVDAATVVATHLTQILTTHANELFGYDEAQHLLDRLAQSSPKLVEDLVPKALSMGAFVRTLQELLAERIPITNFKRIAEAMAEHAPRSQEPAALAAMVRVAMGRSIVQRINGMREELPVITLEPKLERMLQENLQSGQGGGIEPNLAERLHRSLAESAQRQEMAGEPAVVLVSPTIRSWLSRLLRHQLPNLNVLAVNEVPDDKRLRMVAAVGA
ncbi:MAG: flagellar biosynthesis protein FlhA [Pseudomonadota bacterium]